MSVRPTHRHIALFLLFVALVSMAACSSFGASKSKIGTLTGIDVKMDLADISDGLVDKTEFLGIVNVKLDDGTAIKAVWGKSLGDKVTGGMKLEVEPTEDAKVWRVVRIVETP